MDAQTCLQKLEYVGVLAFATVDEHGAPQIRNISAIHYEPEAMYFFTAKGKDFCRQLLSDGRVQILGYTKYKEMIRFSGRTILLAGEELLKRVIKSQIPASAVEPARKTVPSVALSQERLIKSSRSIVCIAEIAMRYVPFSL